MPQKRQPIAWSIVFLIGTVLYLGATAISTETNSTCRPDWATDAYCDPKNNKEECDYDGGDCCGCSCEDTDDYFCGVNGFDCQDPDQASCDLGTDITTACGIPYAYSDGYCDAANNNEDCKYDGGDCCSCTCDPIPGACEVDDSTQCLNTAVECYPWAEDDDDSGSDRGENDSRWFEAAWEIAVAIAGSVVLAAGATVVRRWRDRCLQEADTPSTGELAQNIELTSPRLQQKSTPTTPPKCQVSPLPYRQGSLPPYRSPSSVIPVTTAVIGSKSGQVDAAAKGARIAVSPRGRTRSV